MPRWGCAVLKVQFTISYLNRIRQSSNKSMSYDTSDSKAAFTLLWLVLWFLRSRLVRIWTGGTTPKNLLWSAFTPIFALVSRVRILVRCPDSGEPTLLKFGIGLTEQKSEHWALLYRPTYRAEVYMFISLLSFYHFYYYIIRVEYWLTSLSTPLVVWILLAWFPIILDVGLML